LRTSFKPLGFTKRTVKTIAKRKEPPNHWEKKRGIQVGKKGGYKRTGEGEKTLILDVESQELKKNFKEVRLGIRTRREKRRKKTGEIRKMVCVRSVFRVNEGRNPAANSTTDEEWASRSHEWKSKDPKRTEKKRWFETLDGGSVCQQRG